MEFFPDAAWQRCIVHWYRNIFSHVPSTKVREIAAMLKAIHASEDIVAAREKAVRVVEKLSALRLTRAAELVAAAARASAWHGHGCREHRITSWGALSLRWTLLASQARVDAAVHGVPGSGPLEQFAQLHPGISEISSTCFRELGTLASCGAHSLSMTWTTFSRAGNNLYVMPDRCDE